VAFFIELIFIVNLHDIVIDCLVHLIISTIKYLQELESDDPGRSQTDDIWDSTERVKNTRSAVVAKNKDLEYKCKQQERELERLKEKMHNMSQQVINVVLYLFKNSAKKYT
jgi:biopolymer transport protein ExbD